MLDIIIPAYNSHETIEKTLDSVCKQSIKDKIKVYIIDDCSSKDYNYLKEKYSNEINIFILRLSENRGPGFARQFGLEKSNSKYIFFLDSDDEIYAENSLEQILVSIDSANADVAYSKIIEVHYNLNQVYCATFDAIHSKIYKRDFLRKNNIKFPFLYNSEDVAFNSLVVLYTNNIIYVDCIAYVYRRRQNSLMNSYDYFIGNHIKNYCESILYVIKTVETKITSDKIGMFLTNVFSYLLWYFEDKRKEESIIYICELIKYYDKYAYLTDNLDENYWLNFWTRIVIQKKMMNKMPFFIKYCKNKCCIID